MTTTTTTAALDSLHDIHTATNDVLKGYREMAVRAEPEIQSVIQRLTAMHQQHAAEQAAELSRLNDANKDDTSLQGMINKAVVVVRDWVSQLDRDVLPAVRMGEEALRDKYNKALDETQVQNDPAMAVLLRRQLGLIQSEIAKLPKN